MEPIMDVEVVCPKEYMGDVIGDLSSRRGKIGNMTQRADAQIINARVPLAEMFGYATALRSLTQGRAVYTMQFANYEAAPKSVAEEVINKFQARSLARRHSEPVKEDHKWPEKFEERSRT
jgi:elongation factor G